MAEEKKPFRFLGHEEFTQLSQVEKVNYLALAVAALEARTDGMSLFAEPAAKPKPKPN